MGKRQADIDADLNAMVDAAGGDVLDVIEAYEPLESIYRSAITPSDVYPEASNTTGLPTALVVNSSSAR